MANLRHYWTNQPEKVSNIFTKSVGASDHTLIAGTRNTKVLISKPRLIKKRSFKNFCPTTFLNAVRKICWLDIYLCDDVNNAVELFTDEITKLLDEMAPIKTIQVRSNYLPWMSEYTKTQTNLRNSMLKKAKETGNQQDWREYKKLRNSINNSRTQKLQN